MAHALYLLLVNFRVKVIIVTSLKAKFGFDKKSTEMKMNESVAYGQVSLPTSIRSRFVDNGNGLAMHFLEAGFETPGRPLILLLHGFPELAYSWRKLMLPLAAAGYHVVAPDQRGFGRTTGWDANYDGDVESFRIVNVVKDALGLVSALGYRCVAALFGHDSGSIVAAWCALIRPDVFRSVALMSAPFSGAPPLPFNTANDATAKTSNPNIHEELAALPRPRKHYQWYFSTRDANRQITKCPQGLHAFLRAYYHHKSADWKQNQPYPLAAWSATELEKMPTYYIMDLEEDMAQTVAHDRRLNSSTSRCSENPSASVPSSSRTPTKSKSSPRSGSSSHRLARMKRR